MQHALCLDENHLSPSTETEETCIVLMHSRVEMELRIIQIFKGGSCVEYRDRKWR